MTQVVIPTAGIGSRLGTLTRNINKALMPVGTRPAISYIIDFYPLTYKFIIALGYKGDYIKDYLSIAYPHRKFTYIKVDPYEGKGSGLGLTLKKCKKYIKEDFFFHSNDGIIIDKIDFETIKSDTIFLSDRNVDALKYRTAKLSKNAIIKLFDKTTKKNPNTYNYVGVAYIKDFKKFNNYLSKISIELGESDYFISKIKKKDKILSIKVKNWYDVGDIDDLKRAQKEISDFDNLPKEDEFIYFNDKRVIKFFIQPELSQKRIKRAKILKGFVPKIVATKKNFYAYDYVEGELFSKKIDLYKDLDHFLKYCKKFFWVKIKLNAKNKEIFKKVCFKFYYDKTLERISSFYQNHDIQDNREIINTAKTDTLNNLISSINWDDLSCGIPTRIHGDFHFENILYTDKEKYQFIDWRQDFGGILEYGDMYYDLAKLYHGIIVDHGAIRNNMFRISMSDSNNIIDYEIYRKQTSYDCENIFFNFLEKNKISVKKVKILTALIYLNIATLHHQPYSIFLYYLGKSMLNKVLHEK